MYIYDPVAEIKRKKNGKINNSQVCNDSSPFHMVAANPTKTTAAKAAAENCRSDAPAETGADGDGELDESALELEPEPESEPEPEPELEEELELVVWELFPVLVD